MYVNVRVSPCERVVGVAATEIFAVSSTSALSTCKVSLDEVHARTRICVCPASVHVSDTAAPVLADAVQTTPEPEPAAVTVVAVPAAAHE